MAVVPVVPRIQGKIKKGGGYTKIKRSGKCKKNPSNLKIEGRRALKGEAREAEEFLKTTNIL